MVDDLPLFGSLKKESQPEDPPAERKALTVSELSHRIKGTLEPGFADVWVRGEVSNYRPAPSGHLYFSLKDRDSFLSVAAFGWAQKLKAKQARGFEFRDGAEVLIHGKISVYVPRGSYQLVVDQIEPVGAGALQLAFEELKRKLESEGLFDPARKRALPAFPSRIAVITSPTGAAIRDILNVLGRRAPNVRVTILPALVQGNEAAEQMARAIGVANRHRLGEVILLARGGGSIEDLWCFNDERLARAIAESALPVVSAVGHEIDFTISDFVSDLRAPTPSAGAEILSAGWVDACGRLKESKERLWTALRRALQEKKALFAQIAARLVNPRDRLREQAQRIDECLLRLSRAIERALFAKRSSVERFMAQLDALSPLQVLERGYALVRRADASRSVVKSAKEVSPNQQFTISFHDGEAHVQSLPSP